jgi:hypothetical protein
LRGILNQYYEINRIFILGAGFSYSAGLPLTNDLLQLIHRQASQMEYGDEPWGQAERLINELKYYYPNTEFSHQKIQNGEFNEQIDFEEFLSFTSADSSFLYAGDKLTQHGSYFISFCKKWLGEILVNKQIGLLNRIPQFYVDFVRNLNNSMILTFNWDTVVETLFDSYNIPYRYQLNSRDYESRNKSIPLIKMHGSIDWISKPEIRKNKKLLKFESIGDEFTNIVKAKGNLKDFYERMYYPWIVLPNYDKITQLSNFGKTWETPVRYLNDNLEIVIIGYSLRPDDFHSRSFIYPELVHQSRRGCLKVKVVDFAESKKKEKEIKERFKGVENCKFWFNGFSQEALNFIND